jgi:Tfp pilus assembly protein PilZ
MVDIVGAPQRRRDTRYRVQIPLVLRCGGRTQKLVTEDVSFRGLFARTDTPPVLRQLIRIEAELPPAGVPFASHGMSVYVIEPANAEGRVPGVGIQFYAMGPERTKWEAFINHVRTSAEIVPPAEDAVAPVRRIFPRYEVVLPVRPKNLEELYVFYSRDVSKGGMFLETEVEVDVGRELRLDVEHPDTKGVFGLEAVVRRQGRQPAHGIGVEFVNMDDGRRREFYEFVHSAIPELREVELVDEGDPRLE